VDAQRRLNQLKAGTYERAVKEKEHPTMSHRLAENISLNR